LSVFPFWWPDDHDLEGVELGEAATDGTVVAETLVAVQLDELLEDQRQVVARHGAIGMPGYLDRFPGLQVTEDLPLQLGDVAAKLTELVAGLGILLGDLLELVEAGLQLVDRPLERKPVLACCHRESISIDGGRGLSTWGGRAAES
jgi:hypothetical protein